MGNAARELNREFLSLMNKGTLKVYTRVRDLWWPAYVKNFSRHTYAEKIDALDVFMGAARDQLMAMASEYAATADQDSNGADRQADEKAEVISAVAAGERQVQLRTQFLKSNTGKMFERFVGLALAHTLCELDADFCVLPFKGGMIERCKGLTRDKFKVRVRLGKRTFSTNIDSDLIAFNPERPDADLYLISIKSTLKDRFHNVPFWNLLRLASLADGFPQVEADCAEVLSRVKYISIASDLAKEQPDFASEAGARELLQLDAALLDAAYITSSSAKGVPSTGKHFGPDRDASFFRLSCFVEYLLTGKNG